MGESDVNLNQTIPDGTDGSEGEILVDGDQGADNGTVSDSEDNPGVHTKNPHSKHRRVHGSKCINHCLQCFGECEHYKPSVRQPYLQPVREIRTEECKNETVPNIKDVITLFSIRYPEFNDKVSPSQIQLEAEFAWHKWHVLQHGKSFEYQIATCMVIAHEFARSSVISSEGEIGGGVSGVATSASVGGVSVSLQAKPIKNMTEDYFGSTPYGLAFLDWLNTRGGAGYVN